MPAVIESKEVHPANIVLLPEVEKEPETHGDATYNPVVGGVHGIMRVLDPCLEKVPVTQGLKVNIAGSGEEQAVVIVFEPTRIALPDLHTDDT
jgi:hypothetical protein